MATFNFDALLEKKNKKRENRKGSPNKSIMCRTKERRQLKN